MIAKEIAAPRTGGSFGSLVSYLTSSQGKEERVGSIRLSNCVSTDVESAALEVENTQARNRRARHTTYHLMLAFPAGEQPPEEVLRDIERRACEALGFADHQRVSVVHHDTDHLHVHVAINRVHPRTAKVHSPSFSKLVLDRVCVELEAEYDLQPVRHRARDLQAGLVAGAAAQSRRPPDMERVSGLERLIGFVQRECADSLRAARNWAEMHEIAGGHGVRAQLRGNGLVFVAADGTAVKASSVSRDLSKAALERRLGPFEGAAAVPAMAGMPYSRRPLPQGSARLLYEQYLRDREIAATGCRQATAQLREQCSNDEERLRFGSQRRWAAIRFVAKGRLAWMLWRAYAREADRRQRDRARQRHQAALRTAVGQSLTSWLDWLQDRAARGYADALLALRARNPRQRLARNAVWGDARSQHVLPALTDSVTPTGTVIYRVPGGSIRDDGERMHLTPSASSQAAAEALLRLAYLRYGARIGFEGDEAFRARLERAAVNASLPITLVGERSEQRSTELPNRTADVIVRRGRTRSQ